MRIKSYAVAAIFVFIYRSAFLVSLIDPNKQLSNVKSMFKFLNRGISMKEIYRFITLLGIQILFIKQCLLKFMFDNTRY